MGLFDIFKKRKMSGEEKAIDAAMRVSSKLSKRMGKKEIEKINSESTSDNMQNIKNEKELYFGHEALRYRMIKDFKTSIDFCNKGIIENPNSAYLYLLRAKSKSDLGFDKEALADINKAIEIDKGYADAYTQRANIKMVAEVERLKKINKLGALDYPSKAEFKDTAKVMKSSIVDFEKAVQLDPRDEEAKRGLINLKISLNLK